MKDKILKFIVDSFKFFVKILPTLIKIGIAIGIIGFFFLLGGAYVVWYQEKDRVKAALDKFKSEVTNHYDAAITRPVRIYDKNNKLIGEFNRKNFRPIRTDNI
ncbi:MAG: penicillin-binding protein, partial [Leptospiraceae bacterium]|nr:penicillin-binding protein [Leptospiraceae bacterium]